MAGSLRPDEIQLRVLIDGSPARKELVDLSQQTAKLREEQKKLVEQQQKLRDDKRAASAKGDAAAVKALAAEEAKLRDARRANIDAITETERKAAGMRKEIGLEALSLRELRNELRSAKVAYDVATPKTDQWVQARTHLDKVNTAFQKLTNTASIQQQVWERVRGQYRLTDMSIEQLELEVQRLNGMMRTMGAQDTGLAKVQQDLRLTEAQLTRMRSGLGPFGRLWAEVKTQVMGAGAVLAGMFAAGGLVSGFQGLVRSAKEYSDQLSDVRKTTGLGAEAVKALASEVSGIDTRTSRAELLALARDAGKLGISAKDDVMAFVNAGNQIRVALGEDLGDDAIKNIAKLVDLFKLKDAFGLEDAMLKVGSAINELGMSSTASEGYMVEFLRRMGGIAPLAGITIDQTLALGATLDSLGQTSEVSSTALSKLFVKLGSDAEKYAGLAGMSVDRFRDILQNNALEAFIAVLEGTKRTEGGVVALSETLGDIGIDAARAAGVFGVLSQNTERLREQMGIANAAFVEGVSITNEYGLKNENLAAQLEKLGKEFNKLFVNQAMQDWLKGMVGAAREAVEWLQRNRDMIGTLLKLLVTAVGVWASYRVAVAAATTAQRIAATVGNGLHTVYLLLTRQITLASVATKGFNSVLKANPIGLVVSALTAAVGLLWSFNQGVRDAAQALAAEQTQLRLLHAEILTTNQGTEERRALIQRLKEQYPDYLKQLDADRATNEQLGEAVEFVNQQLINKAVLSKADAEIEAQNERAAERRLEQFDRERALRERLLAIGKEAGVPLEDAGNAVEQAQKFLAAFEKTTGKPLLGVDRSLLDQDIRAIRAWEESFRAETEKSSAMVQARMLLMKQLGMETKQASQAQAQFAAATSTGTEGTDAAVRSVRFLNDAISKLQEQQQDTANTARYRELQQQIEALKREKARITGADYQQEADKNQQHLDDLLNQYKDFQSRLIIDAKSGDEKELAELDAKHAEVLRKVQEQQRDLIAAGKLSETDALIDTTILESEQAQERSDIIERMGERRFTAAREANQRIEELLRDGRGTIQQQDLQLLEEQIQLAEQRGQSTVALEQQRRDLLLRIYDANAEDAILKETEKWDTVIAEQQSALERYKANIAARGLDPTEEEEAAILDQTQRIADLTETKNRIIEGINARHRANEEAANRRLTESERAEMVRRIQNVAEMAGALGGLFQSITQIYDADIQLAERNADADGQRTAEEIARIDQLRDARRRAALTAIATQGAAAIASGVASAAAVPWPGNIPAIITIGATVLGMIAQAKALFAEDGGSTGNNSQAGAQGQLQNVPLGASGLQARNSKVLRAEDGGGVLGGSLHSQGGNMLYDTRTGQPLANVERDELMLIMSRRATEANRDLIPLLLDASRRGERLPVLSRPVAMPNMQRVQQAMGVQRMAQGGAHGSSYVFVKGNGGIRQSPGGSGSDAVFAKAVDRFLAGTSQPLRVDAKVGLLDYERRKTEYEQIKNLNKGARAA